MALRRSLAMAVLAAAFFVVGTVDAQSDFRRGDVDGDGNVNFIADASRLLEFLFNPSSPSLNCLDASDVNDNSSVDIADVILLLSWGVVQGSAPPNPGPMTCGPDPTADGLGCDSYDCSPFVPDSPSPAFTLSLSDETSVVGTAVMIDVSFDNASGDLSGWSFGVCHPVGAATLDDVDETLVTAVLGDPPDFFQVNLEAGGWTTGCLVSFLGGATLIAGVDQVVYAATYTPNVSAIIPISVCDTLGSPPVPITFTEPLGTGPIVPTTLDGAIDSVGSGMPRNDDCAAATPASDGSNGFSVTGATTDGPDLDGFCDLGFAGDDIVHQDVWFTYMASCTGDLRISTLGSGLDTRLAVYSAGPCPVDPATVIACDDDALGFPPGESELIISVVEGDELLIQVGTFSETTPTGFGPLTIECIDLSPPGNDDCSGAVAITGDVGINLNNATTGGPDLTGVCTFGIPDDGTVHNDIWFCYSQTLDGEATISLGTDSWTGRVVVYDGCGCPASPVDVIVCGDESGGSLSLTFDVVGGDSYLIQVGQDGPTPLGSSGALNIDFAPDPGSGIFVRGDSNADGVLNIADPISMLTYFFAAGETPPCLDAADANDDGNGDIGDVVQLLSGLFTPGAPAPAAPYPACGFDPTPDLLGCVLYAPCM